MLNQGARIAKIGIAVTLICFAILFVSGESVAQSRQECRIAENVLCG